MSEICCTQAANALLGEGPIWDAGQSVLYWIDIKRPAVFRWHPDKGQTGLWPMPQPVGCVAPVQSGRLIFADADGFAFLNAESSDITRIYNSESDQSADRFKDGKADRAGRFWASFIEGIAALAVHLTSDESGFTTGSVATIDGGWLA